MVSISSYMFRLRSAILEEAARTKEHKCSTLIQVFIAIALLLAREHDGIRREF
jgi:hypothetical protein